jgi:hypothetical protein
MIGFTWHITTAIVYATTDRKNDVKDSPYEECIAYVCAYRWGLDW